VETKTYVTGSGKVFCLSAYSGSQEVSGFYVHPRTGLLCVKDDRSWKSYWRKRKLKIEDVRIPLPGTPGWAYRQINGLWFRAFERTEEVLLPNRFGQVRREQTVVEFKKRSAHRREIRWIKGQLKTLRANGKVE
jgi:hypothetical protein